LTTSYRSFWLQTQLSDCQKILCALIQEILYQKKKINYRLSLASSTIENTFGILTQRWRILRKPIVANIDMCEAIEKVTVALHNFLKTKDTDMPVHQTRYCRQGYVDYEDDNGELVLGQWRTGGTPLQTVNRLGSNNASRQGGLYFNRPGRWLCCQIS
jgi:hypothetical protein